MIASVAFVALLPAVAQDAAAVRQRYDRVESERLVPLLAEVLRFATYQGNVRAHADQKAWLAKQGAELGFVVRDQGRVTEVELPGPEGAPVLGLIVHGDVQPVEERAWSFPPFAGLVQDGFVLGRGAADDKGPLVQALLAMKSLTESGVTRTHTIRLLVGSAEESDATEFAEYLKTRPAPDYSLVLESAFPVVVGEKAWNSLSVTTPPERVDGAPGAPLPYRVTTLEAGLAASIVPDEARLTLAWSTGTPVWAPLIDRLQKKPLPKGTRLEILPKADRVELVVRGRSAHSGVNLEGGRNALVALARVAKGELPTSGAADLLAFARIAGGDLYGAGLGLATHDPLWGSYSVNVATIKPASDGQLVLTINVRRIPPLTGPQLKAHLEKVVADFNARTGTRLVPGGYYDDEPLAFDPQSKMVKRLLSIYTRATGESAPPAISGGGTYAKRVPNAVAFGMWFPGKPYPGHDVDEKIPIADLRRGAQVLIEALVDLATGPPLREPFKP